MDPFFRMQQRHRKPMAQVVAEIKASEARLAESIGDMKAQLREPDPIKALFGVSQSTLIQINNGEFDA